jgi:7,8-dihydro-6-hydroxymethylpterin-pyrophosphokinase
MLGLGSNLGELKLRVQKAQEELAQLGSPEPPLPEMIDTTNIIRINEYLTKSNESKARLISAYEDYAKKLEEIVSSLLSIQADLKDIIKTEASLIARSGRKKQEKSAKKAKRRTKR